MSTIYSANNGKYEDMLYSHVYAATLRK